MTMLRHCALSTLAVATALALPASVQARTSPTAVTLRATPATSVRSISSVRQPVLRIASGQIVHVDTIAQLRGMEDPVAFYGASGIPATAVLQDAIDIGKVPRPASGGHILTGPIYVEGAEPGDLLEVRVIEVRSRVPYGVNVPGPSGVAPTLVTERSIRTIKFDTRRKVALVAKDVEVPLAPFMGIMAVAPVPEKGESVPTYEPGAFGGNVDFRHLTTGSTLYMPVFVPGALFYTGDPHAAQGDGEVNGTAIEASNSATFQFIVHKGTGRDLRYPIAEDKDRFYVMGMSRDLDDALRSAVEETTAFLNRKAGLSTTDAYVVASVGVDFSIAEAVDGVQLVYGAVPKKSLKKRITVY